MYPKKIFRTIHILENTTVNKRTYSFPTSLQQQASNLSINNLILFALSTCSFICLFIHLFIHFSLWDIISKKIYLGMQLTITKATASKGSVSFAYYSVCNFLLLCAFHWYIKGLHRNYLSTNNPLLTVAITLTHIHPDMHTWVVPIETFSALTFCFL